jgi:hypothetical protein
MKRDKVKGQMQCPQVQSLKYYSHEYAQYSGEAAQYKATLTFTLLSRFDRRGSGNRIMTSYRLCLVRENGTKEMQVELF